IKVTGRQKQTFAPFTTELAHRDASALLRDRTVQTHVLLPDKTERLSLRHYGVGLDVYAEVSCLKFTFLSYNLILPDRYDFKNISVVVWQNLCDTYNIGLVVRFFHNPLFFTFSTTFPLQDSLQFQAPLCLSEYPRRLLFGHKSIKSRYRFQYRDTQPLARHYQVAGLITAQCGTSLHCAPA